ncbi:hypothetical protein HPB50_002235 [Hyalomma asiaticum]|uniref:Uncharacterized protein n=1 Tax=Hyalomma asiaticum TaxID=266040 RepID=A0ACB7RHH0_HYAAI|nr:hypothetical protein HPB50_002235 [Hyalomma asiaticum]
MTVLMTQGHVIEKTHGESARIKKNRGGGGRLSVLSRVLSQDLANGLIQFERTGVRGAYAPFVSWLRARRVLVSRCALTVIRRLHVNTSCSPTLSSHSHGGWCVVVELGRMRFSAFERRLQSSSKHPEGASRPPQPRLVTFGATPLSASSKPRGRNPGPKR